MNEQNQFVSVEDQKKLAPETQEQDKVIPFPEDATISSIAETIEAQAQAETYEFPEGVLDVIRDTLSKQFSNGLKVGANAITAVVYGKIGNGKVNFNEMSKEELVSVLDGIAGFCEVGLSQEFLKILDSGREETDADAEEAKQEE